MIPMIDIHCHILPGLDDGARTMDEALDLADIAVSGGVTTICVTPHTNLLEFFDDNYESEELKDRFLDFQEALRREHIPLEIVRGSEIYVTPHAAERVAQGQIRTMNGTKHCLIEFNFDCYPGKIFDAAQDFLSKGYVPVIAHPERYYCVQEDPLLLRDLLRMGALTQVNKGSVLGKFGRECEMCADFLLDEELVTCIASDAHSPFRRNTDMREISDYMAREYSSEYRDLLLKINPAKIIGKN